MPHISSFSPPSLFPHLPLHLSLPSLPSQLLWLRVRVMLVQCLKDSVVTMATAPPSTPQEVGGERGGALEAVAVFSAKVGELNNCLAQMAQHMGTIVLQQKRAHLVSGCGYDVIINWHDGYKIITGCSFRSSSNAVVHETPTAYSFMQVSSTRK